MILASENLFFNYNDKAKFSYPDFKLKEKETLLVLGKSGVGKTTLLHLLAGFIKPKQGTIDLLSEPFSSLSTRLRDRKRGESIGIIFQKPYLINALSSHDNVVIAAKSSSNEIDSAYINVLFTELNITEQQHKRPSKLSVGEQQRVNIARALANKPKLLLADEPTSALDDENCDAVIELLLKAAEINKSALVIVTHDNRLKEKFKNQIEL